MSKILKNSKSLSEYVDFIIKEALAEADEKVVEPNDVASFDASAPEEKEASTGDKKDEKLGNVKLDDVVDKLNNIRSGKSFKDEAINSNMQQYFNKLSVEEKQALYTFLKGISQIMTGEIQGEQAADPNDSPPSIKMKAADGSSSSAPTKSVKPNVVKEKQKGGGVEDRTPPAVIVPQKR